MSKPVCVFICWSAVAALAGCSGSGSAGNTGLSSPQNKEEAIARLSTSHKQNFENWKQQVVKACDASQAFGLNTDRQYQSEGVDGAALIQANGGSLIFNDSGSLAVVTSYNSFRGVGTTKAEESEQVNGQGYTITAETKREGSSCSLYLYGQKVYETYVAESFVIGAHWTAGKEAKSTSGLPQVRTIGAAGMSEVAQHGVFDLLSQALKPSKESLILISKKLRLTDEQTARLFVLSNFSSPNSTIRIANEPASVWTNQEGGNLIASGSILKKAFDGTSRILPLEVRIGVTSFTFGETKNSADNGNLKFDLDVLVSKKDLNFNYSTTRVELHGLVAFDQNEAALCSRDRASAYAGGASGVNQIQPSVQVMFSPCRTLYSEIETASYKNGFMKSLIPQMLAGVSPSDQFQYGGWDQALSKLALEALDQNKNIRSEIDPTARTRVVGIIADHLEALKREMGRTNNMSQSKDSVLQMGLDWSFRGKVVSSARISQILQAIDNAIDTFKVSSEKLLADLGRQPNAHDDQLSFAQNLDANYKAEAMKSLGLSQQLNYNDYDRDIFNQVIQRKISVDEFKGWTTKFSGIKNEISKYTNIGSLKGDMVSLSIKWLKSGETSLQDLGPIYAAVDNSAVPFEDSTRELVRGLLQSLAGNKDALDFARLLTPEYKQLAVAIRANSKAADYESWGELFFKSILQRRSSIDQLRTWNEMWNAALAFTQREKARTQGEFGSTNEWNRKKVIEVAVNESWSNVEFTGLEATAEVARSKNTCDRYKDYSSLADCGGLRLFSKQKGMLLDPTLSGRYVALATDFTTYMNLLSGFEWTTLRWALIGEFFGSFGPIWSKCDQNAFNQKASTLKTQVNAVARETDQLKKWELERQIKDTVRNCQ